MRQAHERFSVAVNLCTNQLETYYTHDVVSRTHGGPINNEPCRSNALRYDRNTMEYKQIEMNNKYDDSEQIA
jgi:hypothetical protein